MCIYIHIHTKFKWTLNLQISWWTANHRLTVETEQHRYKFIRPDKRGKVHKKETKNWNINLKGPWIRLN